MCLSVTSKNVLKRKLELIMAQNVNPASSSSSGYEKDAMERNSATSSSQVRIYGRPGRL